VERDEHTNRETGGHADKGTNRQANEQANKRTNGHTKRVKRQIEQTERWTNMEKMAQLSNRGTETSR
jgi:hypothetical protein